MARGIAALLFFFIAGAEVHAQNDNWDNLSKTPERLIGILDLPEIVQGGCGPAPNRATTPAFATPSQKGGRVGTIHWHEERDVVCQLTIEKSGGVKEAVPTLESGYEIPAAIVFERRGQWLRVRLKEGSGWIRRSDPNDFRAYPDVLRDNLASTLQTWDGTLPGGDLWLHIRLAAKSACDNTYEGVTDVEGWIPAYHTDRTTLAWFSSRGC